VGGIIQEKVSSKQDEASYKTFAAQVFDCKVWRVESIYISITQRRRGKPYRDAT